MKVKVLENGGNLGGSIVINNAVISGNLSLLRDPVDPNEVATKNYVDTLRSLKLTVNDYNATKATLVKHTDKGAANGVATLDSNSKIPATQFPDSILSGTGTVSVGQIISTTDTTPPAGYLRANGAYVSKSTYSDLYAVIGDTYDDGLVTLSTPLETGIGAGIYWRQQDLISSHSQAKLSEFVKTSMVLPQRLTYTTAFVVKNKLYIVGGYVDTAAGVVSNIYVADINPDGTITSFTSAGNFPVNIYGSSAVVTKDYVWLIAGREYSTYYDKIWYASINADGTLGSWTESSNVINDTVAYTSVLATKSYVYRVGGTRFGSTLNYHLERININSDGTPGAVVAVPVPSEITRIIAHFQYKNNVYFICNTSNSTINAYVYKSTINPDGTLSSLTNINITLSYDHHDIKPVVVNNTVFIIGGNGPTRGTTGPEKTILKATIDASGNLSSFSNYMYELPEGLEEYEVVITKNHIYLLGGDTNLTENVSTNDYIYMANIDNAGLSDYTFLHDGSINKYDGSSIAPGTYDLDGTNPDPSTLFKLPDLTEEDLNLGLYSYIKY